VEFKKSREKVTSDVYQSICAFLNRNGGQVILGVDDDFQYSEVPTQPLMLSFTVLTTSSPLSSRLWRLNKEG